MFKNLTLKEVCISFFFVILSVCAYELTYSGISFLKTSEIQASETQSTLNHSVSVVNTTFDKQLTTLNTNVNNQLTKINNKLGTSLTTFDNNSTTLTNQYAKVPDFAKRFDNQTDCEHNDLCWQNMFTDVLRDTRYTARDVSESSKSQAQSILSISNNVDRLTNKMDSTADKFNKNSDSILTNFNDFSKHMASISNSTDLFVQRVTKHHWYDSLINYTLYGSSIYYNIGRATGHIRGN